MFQTTLTANLTTDPELRYTADGKAVVNLSLAHNSRQKVDGKWVDGVTTFLDATVWEDVAEHVAESLHRGDRVIVSGEMSVEGYTAKDGTPRTRVRVRVDEIGPSLRFATATVKRAERRDTASSASRQNYIDTGEYMTPEQVAQSMGGTVTAAY